MNFKPLPKNFFNRDACELAKKLLGKIICAKYQAHWLHAQIIETEAYYLTEKGSHASLGFTKKRQALFMPPGTIYMYYARGGDSLNISAHGEGNAVLIKSAYPFGGDAAMLQIMQTLNPNKNTCLPRAKNKLCAGQTLVCKSLNLKVAQWDAKQFDPQAFYLADSGYLPKQIIKTTRLGIPKGRDEHLHYRFIDLAYASYCTNNPLTKRQWQLGKDYHILGNNH